MSKAIAILAAAGLLASASILPAAVVDNFESYAMASHLKDNNGWTEFGSPDRSVVYPDTTGSGLVPPTYPALEGSQSVYVYGFYYGRGWGAASSQVGDGATLSWLVREESSSGNGSSGFYLTPVVTGGASPAGVLLDHATDKIVLTGSGSTITSYSFAPATNYKLEMVLDFTNDQFTAYATDVTNVGTRTLLGTQAFGMDLSAATVASTGGILLGRDAGAGDSSPAMWDDIQITAAAVPEPASVGLLSVAGVLALRRRRRA